MYDVARKMINRLRPAILDELGLVSTLQEMIDNWNERQDDNFCRFNFNGDLDQLGEEINIHLYRIVQESLTNITKHAKASDVDIKLFRQEKDNITDDSTNDDLKLIIEDNGIVI